MITYTKLATLFEVTVHFWHVLASSDDQDSSASVTTKRAKLDTNGTLDGAAASTIKWEIEASKSTWTPYSDEHIKTITEAFKTEKADVDITDGKAELTIIFERMVQRNKKSGWERRIRCVSTDGNADPDECKRHMYK